MAQLVFLGKEYSDRSYNLQLEKTTVGRSSDNTLVIQHKSVSHYHCEILTYGNEVIVRDLNSTNGTFVDDARLKPQSGARAGQIIRFGDVEARLVLDPETEHSSEMTAVYDHARVVRDDRRKKAHPSPDPKETFENATASSVSEDTQTAHKTQLPAAAAPGPVKPSAPAPSAPSAPAPGRSKSLWWIGGLLAVALLVWLILALAK